MKALQLHYTSCRRGLSGSAGFQTRSLSPGIRPEEQREIERGGIYRPPRDAAPEPSAAEIAHDFPRALRFYALESGRWALTHSGYTGRDYSGRWGNFFAHTLVLENKSWEASAWPIDYFEWPRWHQGLAPEEDTEAEPAELEEIELGEIETESFRLEDLSEFLREESGRAELLARMGRALLLGRANSRALVVRDLPLNNLYWIACLQKIFPPRHAAEMSFSSYQEDPRGCAEVNATSGETGFSFGEAERYYQFYMFDLVGDVASEVPDDDDDYPALAARWLANKPAEMERFFAFMDLFDHQRVEPELVAAFHLFELAQGRDPALEGERLVAMIRFATRHATAKGRRQLLAVVAEGLQRLGGLRRPEDYDDVVCFLADGAAATGEATDRAFAFDTWLRLVGDHLCRPGDDDQLTTTLATAERTWKHLRSVLPSFGAELADLFLAPHQWQAWQLEKVPVEALSFLLGHGWECLDLVQRCPVWRQSEIEGLIGELIRRPGDLIARAHSAFSAIPAEPAALVGLGHLAGSVRLAGQIETDAEVRHLRITVGQALGRVLANLSAASAEAVRRQLDENREDWDLLYGEWLELRQRASDPVLAFVEYQRAVLDALPNYGSVGLSWSAWSLLEHLEPGQAAAVAAEWLRTGEIDRFSNRLIVKCLSLVNGALSLDPGDREADELARCLTVAAGKRQIELRPDRCLLRRAMNEVSEARRLDPLDLPAIGVALQGISAADYKHFLKKFLPPAFVLVETMDGHTRLITATFQDSHSRAFEKSYLGLLRQRPRKKWFTPFLAALKFWLTFDRRKLGKNLMSLETAVMRELVRILGDLSTSDNEKIQNNLGHLESAAAARWRAVRRDVEEYQSGTMAKIRRWLPRLPRIPGLS